MDPKYRTAVEKDYPVENQIALKKLIESGYVEAEKQCRSERSKIFTTPNQHMHTGYTRWIAVSHFLDRGCVTGLLKNIEARWEPIRHKNGIWQLTLVGKFTNLVACHISEIEDSPRESVSRRDGRLSNQYVFPFESASMDAESPLLNVTLVHGDKNGEFAFIRGYNDGENRASYEELSGNIMDLPYIVEAEEQEDIADPETDIKDDFRREDEQEGGQQ